MTRFLHLHNHNQRVDIPAHLFSHKGAPGRPRLGTCIGSTASLLDVDCPWITQESHISIITGLKRTNSKKLLSICQALIVHLIVLFVFLSSFLFIPPTFIVGSYVFSAQTPMTFQAIWVMVVLMVSVLSTFSTGTIFYLSHCCLLVLICPVSSLNFRFQRYMES